QVLLADGREAVAAVVADALGIAWVVRHEFEVGPLQARELRELVEGEHAIDQEDLVVADRERARHEATQLGGHRRPDLEPDHRAAAAPLEHGLELTHEILGPFLDLDLALADHAQGPLPPPPLAP